ncbi:MAG: hypothetical protein DRO12_03815 [Thermoprotei archaeon]|nr:MAG: hypothetical protein DRO12_03815 [Thermoprotei archaeon]
MTRDNEPFGAYSKKIRPRRGGVPGSRREHVPREKMFRERLEPRPIDGVCNPLCPFFRCSRGALIIRRTNTRGKMQPTAFCTWVGDLCIGTKCQYAHCARRALLPDGRCLYAVREQEKQRQEEDFERELERELKEEERAMSRLIRRRYGKDLEEEFF